MKKLLSLVCMLTMAFSLAACGAQGETQTSAPSSELSTSQTSAAPESEPAENTQQPSETESSEAAETAEPEDTGTTVLVAYFSVTGNTKALAEYAADALKADLSRRSLTRTLIWTMAIRRAELLWKWTIQMPARKFPVL